MNTRVKDHEGAGAMNKIQDIRNTPVVLDKVHESVYRSFQLMRYVREMLELNTPQSVILEIMDTCYLEDSLPQIHSSTIERELTPEELRDFERTADRYYRKGVRKRMEEGEGE